jgi:predicted DNA-binding transcriptional regulator YafY
MKISRLYRVLRLITLLHSRRGYSVDQLAAELDVSRRTVFRDLNMLEQAHIPYYFDEDTGGYRLSAEFFLPAVNLTLPESLSLLALTGTRSDRKSHLPLVRQAHLAAGKIESTLPQQVREYVGSLAGKVSVRQAAAADHEGYDDIFDALTMAIAERRICKVRYESFYDGKELHLRLRPLKLAFIERAWYLFAFSEVHEEIRTFKLVRVRSLTLLKRQFATPAVEAVDDHLGQAWNMIPEGAIHDIHLHFAPKVARNVAEVLWHASQRVEFNEDGSCEFHACVDGLREISWWVIGYGDQVTVREPKALADRVLTMARGIVAKYPSAKATKGGRR